MITFIGDPITLAAPAGGAGDQARTRIATVFPRAGVVVTLPGIHATQRQAFADQLASQRAAQGLPPLAAAEQLAGLTEAVDLIVAPDKILIRPDPDRMDLAFEADALLQELTSKRNIRFLFVTEQKVRDAVRRRGEAWRISLLPKSSDEIKRLVASASTSVGGRAIYYYSAVRGSRTLTCGQFAALAALDDDSLRRHLLEIADLARRRNARGHAELELFMADDSLTREDFARLEPPALAPERLRAGFDELRRRFEAAVPPAFQQDDLEDGAWRNRMYAALIDHHGDELSESDLLGLGAEFFMQIEWLPGARVDGGELIFDPVDDEPNMVVRGLICNLVQDTSDLEYVNIGRVAVSLCRSRTTPQNPGRREVYVAHYRSAQESLQIIRMQKWGVREHLDEGKDLLRAIVESEEYTDYVMDRRLGCRQLGMNMPSRVWTRTLTERYAGRQTALAGITIRSPYFQRDFVAGFASDKLPSVKLKAARYAAALAGLLGQAAAANMIVGRCDVAGLVIFDDGDEIVIEDAAGQPTTIVVADPTGSFGDYAGPLPRMAASYAGPVTRRAPRLPDPPAFARGYVAGFLARFRQIQDQYRSRKRAFDDLFKHRLINPAGNFAWRWQQVLRRLDQARPDELAEAITAAIGQVR